MLASKLKMTVKELLSRMDSKEITEWMAYYTTESEQFKEDYERQQELHRQSEMNEEARAERIKSLLLGKTRTNG